MFIKQKVTARKHQSFKVSPIFSQYQIFLSEIWIIYFNENPNVLKVLRMWTKEPIALMKGAHCLNHDGCGFEYLTYQEKKRTWPRRLGEKTVSKILV